MQPFSLEPAIGVVLRIGTIVASIALALGFALSLVPSAAAVANAMLAAGIFVLIFTPVARVIVSLVDFLLQRDWLFAVLNTIVLLLVGSAFIAAFR